MPLTFPGAPEGPGVCVNFVAVLDRGWLWAWLLRLGGSMLGQLLAADRGHRGPRVPCGNGHVAAFAGYRDKS